MKVEDFLNKIKELKDLRSAISLAKKFTLIPGGASIPAAKPEAPIAEPKPQAKAPNTPLQHLGIKNTISGVKTHMIGVRGQPNSYEVDFNTKHEMAGQPAYTVHHVDSNGSIKSRSPKTFSSMKDAVTHVVGHYNTGKWE